MVYLITQITLFIFIAAALGVILGWWFWGKKAITGIPLDEESIETKRKLEQCRRESAALRREAKAQQETIDRFSRQKVELNDESIAAQLESAQARIQALLDEVQLRDDTIHALQKQIQMPS